jgi:pilus assembly protein CpaB
VKRRLLAALAALVLALVGIVVLMAYVSAADSRAMAGMQTVQVLVVAEPVPAGTPADQLGERVRTEVLPVKAAVPGRVQHLADLQDRVTTVDMQPGEQLMASRFAEPGELRPAGTVDVPAGDQEVSVQLEPQRAVGGRLAAGDTVGVYVSMTMPDGTLTTHVVLHRVLVTQVQGAPAGPPAEGDTATSASTTPTQNLMVTFAVTAQEAEAVVFGVEHGTLWLSLEPEGADLDGTTVLTPTNVYTEAYQ